MTLFRLPTYLLPPARMRTTYRSAARSDTGAAGRAVLPAAALTVAALAASMLVGRTGSAEAAVTDPASVVNPFIGTTNSGDDFPGADAPFGMVQWSPDTPSRPDGGGYEYNDTSITGFSLTHISGPGCGAGGDIPVLPTTGSINTGATDSFSHANESANAGYYSVRLNNGIRSELTTTARTGMARFTFPPTNQANLIFKLGGSQNGDSATSFTIASNTEVTGSVTSGNFCGAGNSYTVYFDMQFDRSFATNGTYTATAITAGARHLAVTASGRGTRSAVSPATPEPVNHPTYHGALPQGRTARTALTGPNGGYVTFDTTSNQVVQAKVGLSYVSVAGAHANLSAENPSFDFSAIQSAAHSAWNALLGRIQISGGTSAQQQVFYTALYHALLHPNIDSDAGGQYRGVDGNLHTVDSGHTAEYTNFSGWDIYRTQAQLEALVNPSAASDTAQSMVDDFAQASKLPKWMEYNGETYVMVGDPADAIIADYRAFGATSFDAATALADMVREATQFGNIRPGLNYLTSLGYLPSDGSYGCCNSYGPASTALEYNTADFAISALAAALGDTADQQTFADRAQDWTNMLNTSSGFMQPRNANGSWVGSFSPTSGTGFVEGDSWQYTGMVPFNLAGLAAVKGGGTNMVNYLNTVLSNFLGQSGYADLRNEPSLDLPWEYDYAGQPYRTQQVVRQVQDQIWSDAPAGLAGNDDLGTMSAWFVWSALGAYPETPGTADLALGSPMFTQAVVTLPTGNTLTINGNGATDSAPYVQSATWNGAAWNNAYAPRGAITSGGTLTFTLGTSANTAWAASPSAAPPSYGKNTANAVYNNIGIASDGTTGASFDSSGNSYSYQALAAAGVTPGSTVKTGYGTFTWPGVAAGSRDNYQTVGQTLSLSGSGAISFLGAATNGPSTGTATVNFTDGSTQRLTLALSDWTLNGGSAAVMAGNTTAITTSYRDTASGTSQSVSTYVFATAPIALPAGKTVASITLPATTNQGLLHVFAIGFSAVPTGPIVSGVSPSLCVDDHSSLTTNGNPIQIWGCNGTGAQQWTVAPNGSLQVLGGCMDVTSGGTANGTKIQYYTCNGTGAQVWQPQANGALLNPQSGKCLDDPGSSTTPGTQLQIYTCNGTNAQKWTLP